MVFESFVEPEDWSSAVIVPLDKGKGERTECKNYRGISLLGMVRRIYDGILVDRFHRMTGALTDDEQWGFRAGRGCIDQIFTQKHIGEKIREKNSLCGFNGFREGVR